MSFIIPNYNGRELLEKFLKKNLSVIFSNRVDHEVIVVDDASTDSSVSFLQGVSGIRVVRLLENKGFSRACNEGAMASKKDFLFFLNTDAELKENNFSSISDHLHKEKVFAVSPQIVVPNRGVNVGMIFSEFKRGFIREKHLTIEKSKGKNSCPTLYACGAAFACKREKFIELGGFDEVFSPYFFEDFDLGYRAWKRGWINLYDPRSIVVHHEQQTIGKNPSFRNLIYDRNRLIFHWMNLSDKDLIFKHAFFLIFKIPFSFIKGDIKWLKAFWMAFEQRGKIREKRKIEKEFLVRGDKEILDILKNAV